jgi:hypothetical protein
MTYAEEMKEMENFLRYWKGDPGNLKKAFLELMHRIESKKEISLSFKARPGISFSLRAGVNGPDGGKSRLFALVDIIDDDPENRWLSVCFYEGTMTDKDGLGNLIPGGILGEDGYCFDLDENNEYRISYLKERIDEAYRNTILAL